MLKNNVIKSVVSSLAIAGIVLGSSLIQIQIAYAAALTSLSDTQSSVKVSTLSDHTIQFVTPTGIGAGQAISITFPSGYATGTFNINNFDFATSSSASCASVVDAPIAASASGVTWGVSVATATVYVTSATAVVPANRCVQLRIGSNAISQASGTAVFTNPSSPGSYVVSIAGSFGDTGSITNTIITDDTVAMTGTVNQSLTFTISTSTIYFGTLGSGAAKFASSTNTAGDTTENIAHTLAVGTNAPSGFTLTVRGQTLTSLQNASNTISAAGVTATSSVPGTEQFGLRVTEAGGTGTAVNSTYASSTGYGYAATATSSSVLATGSGSTPTSTYSLRYLANIATITEAGTYAASLVYVATANF
jgi:hypothetical protein